MPASSTPSEYGNWPAHARTCRQQRIRPSTSRARRLRTATGRGYPRECPNPALTEFHSAHRLLTVRDRPPSIAWVDRLPQGQLNRARPPGSLPLAFSWFLTAQESTGISYL